MRLAEVSTPALCVDVDVLERNLATMSAYFADRPCGLRPHLKAHKTLKIAERQRDAGCSGFTCATVHEAEVLADAGFEDVLIANEVLDATQVPRLAEVAGRIDLTVAVDSEEAVDILDGIACGALVDVNVGLPRCGVPPEDAVALARRVAASSLELRGVMGYEGHAVGVADRAAREEAARTSMTTLLDVAAALRNDGHDVTMVSAGGTGTYDITGDIAGITEVQAGSYALMDTAYAQLDLPFAEALRCRATLVSVHGQLGVLDAGLKTLAVDHGNPALEDGVGAEVFFLSDEHTTLVLGEGFAGRPGDRMWLRPSHVDPTVNLHDRLYAIRGDEIVDVWPVSARGYGR